VRLISVHPKWRWSGELESFFKRYCDGLTLHICCGFSRLGDVRVDIDPKARPDVVCDMLHLPFRKFLFDVVLCDPPYKFAYDKRADFVFQLRDVIKPKGRLVLKTNFIPRLGGFKEEELWLYEGARWWADLSVITVWRRVDDVLSWGENKNEGR